MKYIIDQNTKDRPGHYSPGISCNGFTFISGQLPIDWVQGEKLVDGGIEQQTRQAIKNLAHALALNGLSLNDVVKTTVLVAGVKHWPQVDAVYKALFGDHKPARTVIPTMPLHYDALVEIEAIARETSVL